MSKNKHLNKTEKQAPRRHSSSVLSLTLDTDDRFIDEL
jgi:hypothetical protein